MYRTLLAIAALAVSGAAASAETITVCADGCDYTSINAAISAASDGDVIQLSAETYFEGEQIDTLGKAITLSGVLDKAGEPASVLDGAGTHRVLICQSGETSATSFENLAIQNGFAADYGGGSRNQASSPSFSRCSFRENSSGFYGGGMYNAGSSPVVARCVFVRNHCDYSGGSMSNHSESMPVISDCLFEENTAGHSGGAMSNICSSDPVISDSRFVNNEATLFGGAIQNWGLWVDACGSSPEIFRCEFEGNSADEGGAILNQDQSDPLILTCVFRANLAARGGAVGVFECDTTILDCDFFENIATDAGGAFSGRWAASDPGSFFIYESDFIENVAPAGGAVALSGSQAVISGCKFRLNSASAGGALQGSLGFAQVEACEFVQNEADAGGGAYVNSSPGGLLEYSNCLFSQNRAVGSGAGLSMILGNAVLRQCSFLANESSGIGGGVYVDEDVVFEAFDCEWSMNSAADGGGLVSYANYMRLKNCLITGNVATDGAGGMENRSAGKASFEQSAICGNSAPQILGSIEIDEGSCVETACDDCDLPSGPCATDLDENGSTDGGDLGVFFAYWGECEVEDCPADFNDDEVVDGIDLGILFSAWGPCK